MKQIKYPLDQLMRIKKKRFDQAVQVLEEKTRKLKKEQEKLRRLEKERNEVRKHKAEKIKQFNEEFDMGTTSEKIKQKKIYLEVVGEKLAQKEKIVTDQKKVVQAVLKEFDLAKADMIQKKKDVEKLEIHKKQWQKEIKYFQEKEMEKEHDELGSSRYVVRKIKKNH